MSKTEKWVLFVEGFMSAAIFNAIVNLKVLDLLILVPLLILLIVITRLKGSICYEKCK